MNNNQSKGIGFFGILTIVFIVLKLTGNIDWSWFWVLSPILLPFLIFFPICIIIAIVASRRN